jgi:acyl-CoA thioesterase
VLVSLGVSHPAPAEPHHPRTEPPARVTRCRQRARAWWGHELLAETDAALRVDRHGHRPTLHFPTSDVRMELFSAGPDAVDDLEGAQRWWVIDLPVPDTDRGGGDVDDWSATAEVDRSDGRALWQAADAGPDDEGAHGWRSGHVCFDHPVVRVELVEPEPGGPPGVELVTRWPTWGDAADLVELLDVEADGPHRYVTATRDNWARPVVEGSQMLGQALVAACRDAGGRRPVSAHMVITRAADTARPLEIDLEVVSSGRTFTTVVATVTQAGRCCATSTILLDETGGDAFRHQVTPPPVAAPHDCPPLDMSVSGRAIRMVDGAYTNDPDAPVGPPELDAWVRFADLPDDPALHAGLLAQFTGHLSIAAAFRPHPGIGQVSAHRTLSTAVNAIAISFHRDVRADEWMLYHHLSTFAGDGMTHSECRVHDEGGDLIASFSVDAMVRPFAPTAAAAATAITDDRRAL